MLNAQPIILKGAWVQLEPFNESHKAELYEAAQDEALWTYHRSTGFGDKFYRWFDKAMHHLEQQEHLPFVVQRLSDKKIIGTTRYYNIKPKHHRLAIGTTWYSREAWGTYVNPECKFLLLKFAFENCHVNRVEFAIDIRNTHSCAAVEKLGAIKEGVLRQHIVLKDGVIRDDVIFSIIKPDWPHVKKNLQARLKKFKA